MAINKEKNTKILVFYTEVWYFIYARRCFYFGKKENFMKKIRKFFSEVKKELSKVKWPSKNDMVKYSIATISFVIFFAVFFYLIDLAVAFIKSMV